MKGPNLAGRRLWRDMTAALAAEGFTVSPVRARSHAVLRVERHGRSAQITCATSPKCEAYAIAATLRVARRLCP